MKITLQLVLVVVVASLTIMISSCKSSHEYNVQIASLDSVKNSTNDLMLRCNQALLDWGSQYPDSMLLNIRFIQDHFKGVMKTGDAMMVASYSNAAQDMLQVKIDLEDVVRQLSTFHNEISALQKALREQATHDKNGNEINENYVQEVLKKENENLKRFDTRLNELSLLLNHASEIATNSRTQVNHIADSLNNTINKN